MKKIRLYYQRKTARNVLAKKKNLKNLIVKSNYIGLKPRKQREYAKYILNELYNKNECIEDEAQTLKTAWAFLLKREP